MGILTREDVLKMAATGQKLKDLPSLHSIPNGFYFHPRKKRVVLLQADHLFIPFHQDRGLEFLAYERSVNRETAEACVYLRELAVLEPAVASTEAPPKTAKRKRNKRNKLKKGGTKVK